MMGKSQYRFKAISLFSGAGGMDVGFARAGVKIIWANEILKHPATTFKANHPSVEFFEEDIATAKSKLPKQEVDFVFGGPPCQGFSVAGKMDIHDPRSKLVFEFMDVVKIKRPTCFVMENVKALAALDKFKFVREALLMLAEQYGYLANFIIINAKDFGVPQSRERVLFIGVKKERKIRVSVSDFKNYTTAHKSIREIFAKIGKSGTDENPITCKAKITLAERPVLRKSPYSGMLFNGMGRPLNIDGVSCTLPASMGGNKTPIIDEGYLFDGRASWVEQYHSQIISGKVMTEYREAPSVLRRLTLKEAALIQTFPEDYIFCGPTTSQYAQIGNAVPCQLAEKIACALVDLLKGETAPAIASQSEFDFAY